MSQPKGKEVLTPQVKIAIAGNPLPPEAIADLSSVTVVEDLEGAGMFTLQLKTWDAMKGELTWVDDKLFDCGNTVEIKMGYDKLETLIIGDITGLEPSFSHDAAPTLTVRGHDLRHRLMRGTQSRSFLDMKDSEIASQIASDRGIDAKVEDSKEKLTLVLQSNKTDWDFLQYRAERIGYEVLVNNKTLYFRSPQNASSQVLKLNREEDLLDFSARLSTMNQIGQVEVRGWDPQKKELFVSKAGVGNETTKMKGSVSGPKVVDREFGKTSHTIANVTVSSQAEANQIALKMFNEMALNYITGDGSCLGRTDLHPGTAIEITGIGKRFSGSYYVTAVTHSYSKTQGYRTQFSVKRNAAS
ncbi:MAG: contractile injection system protein, VgrG/Pvc8 family [Oscillatoriaceae cyanobacterium Prado104]|jgi:phage protein D|nr:contractile injection system protein, VgrG/Pvc8 family [Oscillatoriaceae cyanobacterium Prado104]